MQDCPGLREHLLELLAGGSAHLGFADAVKGVAPHMRGSKPAGSPHSAWQLLEHLRLAQNDILEFSRNPKHVSPKWPDEYWPQSGAPPDAKAWNESVRSFEADLDAMRALVTDAKNDLFARIPHGQGQTLLREALLVADHNAYHLGQLILLRRMLESTPER